MAAAKARENPALLAAGAQQAWYRRWMGLVAVAIQVAAAESLLEPSSEHRAELDGVQAERTKKGKGEQ